jgi:carboxypeptidase C (cathepsin A)
LFKEFCTEKADVNYLAQFITSFLSQHKLWGRPLFLCGESYGGYRVSLLSYELITKYDLQCEGLILIAPFLSCTSLIEAAPNLIAEANFLCSYAVSAWYHKRSSLNRICKDEASAYKKAKEWIFETYLPARFRCSPHELDSSLIKKLADLCGVSFDALMKEGLNVARFCNNLFPHSKSYAGRVDARYTLEHPLSLSPYLEPSCVILGSRLSPHMNAYIFNEVGWEGKERYINLSMKVNEAWRVEDSFSELAFTSLRSVLKLSPKLRLYAAAGYYDLAVPLSSVEFDLTQLADTASLKQRIHMQAFPAGHMMYVHDKSRKDLSKGIGKFFHMLVERS